MKDNWIIPNADRVTVVSKKEVYPVTVICDGHKFIEAIEIPNKNYINIKIKGTWAKIYLPLEYL